LAAKGLTIRQKLYLVFGIFIVFMIMEIGYTYRIFTEVSQVAAANLSTYRALRGADGILKSVSDIETGVRGYIISGDDQSLEPYHTGKSDFQLHYNNLKQLFSGNQAQLDMLNKLNKEYQLWLAFQADMIEQKRLEVSA